MPSASGCRKTSIVIPKWVFSVACYVGFASCKTFGKQPKRPCFGRSPKAGRRDASPRIHPRHGRRACMPKGSARCRANKVYTAFHGERGLGDRDNKSEVYFKYRLFLQTGADGFCRPYFYTLKGIKQSLSAEITPYRV